MTCKIFQTDLLIDDLYGKKVVAMDMRSLIMAFPCFGALEIIGVAIIVVEASPQGRRRFSVFY